MFSDKNDIKLLSITIKVSGKWPTLSNTFLENS